MSEARPYRLFDVALKRKAALSPALWRLTFEGADVREMSTRAADQRIKLFFPTPDGKPPGLMHTPDWYAAYKATPVAIRPPMRTYTIRGLRAQAGEVDIDFVLHGETGPASTWATRAHPGDRLQIMAPNARYAGDPGGYEWKPPADLRRLLLIGDETALPAIAGILEDLAALARPPQTQAFIEVPAAADQIALPQWPGLALQWLPRGHAPGHPEPGDLMVEAARRAVTPVRQMAEAAVLAEVDIEAVLPWERAAPSSGAFYGWVAGESAAVLAIRKLLVAEKGVDRTALNLMGYWRNGRAME